MADIHNLQDRINNKRTPVPGNISDTGVQKIRESQNDLMELFEVLLDGLDLFGPSKEILFNGPSRRGGYWQVKVEYQGDNAPDGAPSA